MAASTNVETNCGLPVLAMVLCQPKDSGSVWLLVGGGGGPSKTGVPNAMAAYQVDIATRSTRQLFRHSTGSRAVMCMALHPSKDVVVCGLDENCAAFAFDKTGMKDLNMVRANFNDDDQGYLKAVAFSPNGKLVASAGTDGKARLLSYPSMSILHVYDPVASSSLLSSSPNSLSRSSSQNIDPSQNTLQTSSSAAPIITTPTKTSISSPPSSPLSPSSSTIISNDRKNTSSELSDVCFDRAGTMLLTVSAIAVYVWKTEESRDLLHAVDMATSISKSPSIYRNAKFFVSKDGTSHILVSINAKDRKRAWLSIWSCTETSIQKKQTVAVSNKPVSALTINHDMHVASFGCNDGSVGSVLLRALQHPFFKTGVHSMPVTAIHASVIDDDIVVWSGSPDYSLRLTVVKFSSGTMIWFFALVVLFIAILVAFFITFPNDLQSIQSIT